jgi:hypothetical protein
VQTHEGVKKRFLRTKFSGKVVKTQIQGEKGRMKLGEKHAHEIFDGG